MHNALIHTVPFLIVLAIMVIVHEFGHFAAAKFFGVRVEAFSVGFGPRLFGIKIGETDYRVCALPLGGYVKMSGENPGDEITRDPGEFTQHPRWQRMLIGIAGPAANFVLAIVLMTGLLMEHHEIYLYVDQAATLDWVTPGSAAAIAGLAPGDKLVQYDNVQNPTWRDVEIRSQVNLNHSIPVVVDRNGQRLSFSLPLEDKSKGENFRLSKVGIFPVEQPDPIRVNNIGDKTPAAAAGLQPQDQFAAVDGHVFHSVESLIGYLQSRNGAPLQIDLDRAGTKSSVTIQPALLPDASGAKGWKLGFSPVQPPYRVEKLGLPAAIAESFKFNRANSNLILEVLQRVLTGKMSVDTLSGPVGIARQTAIAVEMPGWQPIIQLMTVISLNLGILNLLPFPILDGGLILFLLIESVIRRDIDMAIKERVYQVAFVLIILFAAYIIFNDISKLPIFAQSKP